MPQLWRHKKRGTVYEIITDHASVQCSSYQNFEDTFAETPWTVYRSVNTHHVYIRPTEEFLDGRFEMVAAPGDDPGTDAL